MIRFLAATASGRLGRAWMPRPADYIPKHCKHKASGRGYVRLDGKVHYTGRWGSRKASQTYDRLIAEWATRGRTRARAGEGPATVADLCELWADHMRRTGRHPPQVREAVRVARDLATFAGDTPVAAFGPKTMKRLRDVWAARVSRQQVNRYARVVRRMFRWGVEEEIVPASAWQALTALNPVPMGTPGTREKAPVGPVDDRTIEMVLPHLRPVVAAMVRLQRLTGMRPGEVVRMRPVEVERSGEVWVYRPVAHKKTWRGARREILIGPRGQAVLRPWLERQTRTGLYVFRVPGHERPYRVASYTAAIARGCKKAGVPAFCGNMVRHTTATAIRERFGIEAAQVVLGHDRPDTTAIYAESSRSKAAEIMKEIG